MIPAELVRKIAEIVDKENYLILKEVFPSADVKPPIFLSVEEAEALIDLAVIEKKKSRLKYPYYDEDHKKYDQSHEEKFDDIQMGIYEKTIYYVESAFKKGTFDHLL